MKDFLRYALAPIILLIIFSAFIVLYNLFRLPPPSELIEIVKRYYLEHNPYLVVFLGALVEGLLFINWYLPGSIIIVLGVIFARDSGFSVLVVVFLIILGFLLTSIANYFLGKYGWYRLFLKLGLREPLEKAKARTERYGLPIVFSTYFHPNVGALTATSAGILGLPFAKFLRYSTFALIVWNVLWGLLVYFIGPAALKLMSTWVIILVLAVWLTWLSLKYYKNRTRVR